MRRMSLLWFVFFLFGMISTNILSQEDTGKRSREKAMDRKVHIEKDLILEIPKVPRWCDQLDLKNHRVNVGDCVLYVEEEGKGIPIVLLHGGPGGTHHSFHPYFSRAKDFARIIYYDQRGCGLSDYKKGDGYTVDQAADDLENLRKALKIDKWVVLGWSYGGFLGQRYMMKYPECIRGLVLVTAGTGLPSTEEPKRQNEFISEEERKRIEEVTSEIIKLSMQRKFLRQHMMELMVFNRHINGDWKRQHYYKPSRKEIAQFALYGWKHDANFNSIMSKDMRKFDLEGAFEECPIPTLIIDAKWDLTWNMDKPEKLRKNHPDSELVMFEHSAHVPFSDEPDEFFQVLQDFVHNLPGVSSRDLSAWKRYLAEWMKRKADPYLAGEMSQSEKASIEEFNKIRAKIQAGEKFEDGSTPLRALLTILSSLRSRDKETFERNIPLDLRKLGRDITEEMLAEWEIGLSRFDILRSPPPPSHPTESEFWPIYVSDCSGKKLVDTLLIVFWKGKWMYLGNLDSPGNWRQALDRFKAILEMAGKK